MEQLTIFYSWQSLLLAAVAWGMTQLVKAAIDTVYEVRWARMGSQAKKKVSDSIPPIPGGKPVKMGKVVRQQSIIVTRFVLPMTPILMGIAYANLIPLIPEPLMEYLSTNEIEGFEVFSAKAAWGGACGMFSNYLYDRVKKTMQHAAQNAASTVRA